MLRKALLTALLSASFATHAADSFNLGSTTCTGDLTTSFSDGTSLTCVGDLSLSGGSIESDTKIALTASGSLGLYDMSLTAPSIFLTAGGSISINDGVKLQSTGAGTTGTPPWNAGLVLSAGGNQVPPELIPGTVVLDTGNGQEVVFSGNNLQLAVPEPSASLMALAGLALIGQLLTRGIRKA